MDFVGGEAVETKFGLGSGGVRLLLNPLWPGSSRYPAGTTWTPLFSDLGCANLPYLYGVYLDPSN